MSNLGCTIIQKERGLACDLSITWDFQKKRGVWTKLKTAVRPLTRKSTAFSIVDKGDVTESTDIWDGKEIWALSIYPPGAQANADASGSTGMPALFHLICGDAKSVYERVTCGNFLSGKALIWRTRENGEFEFWFGCS